MLEDDKQKQQSLIPSPAHHTDSCTDTLGSRPIAKQPHSPSADHMPGTAIESQDAEAADYFDLEHDTIDELELRRHLSSQARPQPLVQTSISDRRGLELNLGNLQELGIQAVAKSSSYPLWSQPSLSTLIRECRDIHVRAPSTCSSICSASLATPLLTPPEEKQTSPDANRNIWQSSQAVDTNTASVAGTTPVGNTSISNTTITASLGPPTSDSELHRISSPLWLHGALGHAGE